MPPVNVWPVERNVAASNWRLQPRPAPAPVAFNRAAGVGVEGWRAGPLALNFSYEQ